MYALYRAGIYSFYYANGDLETVALAALLPGLISDYSGVGKVPLLDAFTKLRKAATSFVICLSIGRYGTN